MMRAEAAGFALESSTDVCVVGAGPAGLALALRMARHGRHVLLLESGHDRYDTVQRRLAAGDNGGRPYPRLETTRARGLGGSAFIWDPAGLRCRPLDPVDFEPRSDVGREGWPISYDDVRPYIDEAQRLCGLPTDYSSQAWAAGDGLLPLDEQIVETQIFMFMSRDRVLRDLASAAGDHPNIRVVTNATARDLRLNDVGSRVETVVFLDAGGRELIVRPRVTVLAAGGIENARLLLANTKDRAAGLGNAYDQVGRYFMEHPHLSTGYIDDPRLLSRMGTYDRHWVGATEVLGYLAPTSEWRRQQEALASSWKLERSSAAAVSASGRALHGIGQAVRHRRWPLPEHTGERVVTALQQPGDAFRAARERVLGQSDGPNVVRLSVMAEQEPNPSSRVVLSGKRDKRGALRAELQWRLTDLDRHTIRAGQDGLDKAMRSAGFAGVRDAFGEERPPTHIGTGAHHLGTTRMHVDPRHGVVDVDCRLHEANDLYIAGSSVFTTSGSANPTLTLLALTLRLADHLDRRLESPGLADTASD